VEWNLQSWLRTHINGLAGPFSGTACGALPCGMAMISRGILFHHDASRHGSLPALGGQPYVLLTQDDDSRRVVGAMHVPRETSWTHLLVVRQTVLAYGRPLAYDVDNHRIVARSRIRATDRLSPPPSRTLGSSSGGSCGAHQGRTTGGATPSTSAVRFHGSRTASGKAMSAFECSLTSSSRFSLDTQRPPSLHSQRLAGKSLFQR
jgi:hypothetical protein